MQHALQDHDSIELLLQPETPLEEALLREDPFRAGLLWGEPRFGHPEGKVLYHIREVLDNVDRLNVTPEDRQRLRLVTFAHDTFKYLEDKREPRDWNKHHGVYARRFLEQFTDDSAVLDITELHDEAYYAWRTEFLYHNPEEGRTRLEHLLRNIGYCLQLYYLFFKCDTRTGDKIQTPVRWFEKTVEGIHPVTW